MRIVKVFWGLDSSLAYARHFPAINWLTSYSLYLDTLKGWCDDHIGKDFMKNREWAMGVLQNEAELQEIVKLVGMDSLSASDKLTLETAKMIREDFLQQNAFVDTDNYSSYDRQARMLQLIRTFDSLCRKAIAGGAEIDRILSIPEREQIARAKTVPIDAYKASYEKTMEAMAQSIDAIVRGGEQE